MLHVQNSCPSISICSNRRVKDIACLTLITIVALTAIQLLIFNDVLAFSGLLVFEIAYEVSLIILVLNIILRVSLSKKPKLFKTQSSPIQTQLPTASTIVEARSTHLVSQEKLNPKTLPHELNLLFLSYLDLPTLELCYSIPGWEEEIDLKTFFPFLSIFDETSWKKHIDLDSLNLSMEDYVPPDKNTSLSIIKTLLPSLSIAENAGLTLLTIPKGLTLNKLIEGAKLPKQGTVTNFQIDEPILEEFGTDSVKATYRILITNNIVTDSNNVHFMDHPKMVKDYSGEIPKILELATLLAVTCMSSQKHLYISPINDSHCVEQMKGRPLTIGFNSRFIEIATISGSDFGFGNSGVGFVKKL